MSHAKIWQSDPALSSSSVEAALAAVADPKRAVGAARYFKAGPGEYAEGDRFVGVSVPDQRVVARDHRRLPRPALLQLLQSPWHEHRHTALVILCWQFDHEAPTTQTETAAFFLQHRRWINNWDLVDVSAPRILGAWLLGKTDAGAIEALAGLVDSDVMWDRRIAMLSTLAFIRADRPAVALTIADRLHRDPHDLMHKAVGWMLREVGERDLQPLRAFLTSHAAAMPRTMVRTAIEKLDDDERRQWRSLR